MPHGRLVSTSRARFRKAPTYVELAQVIDKIAVSRLGVVQRIAVLESSCNKESGGRGLMQTGVQSVKSTDTVVHKGYDAGKKVSGIKRRIAVDTQGLPHAVAITTVEVSDRKGV